MCRYALQCVSTSFNLPNLTLGGNITTIKKQLCCVKIFSGMSPENPIQGFEAFLESLEGCTNEDVWSHWHS
jgi:hypothetical protein